jgi:hypothetical protein
MRKDNPGRFGGINGLIYTGHTNSELTETLEIIIWNNNTEPLIATLYITNLNDYIFRLDSVNLTSINVIPGNGTITDATDVNTCNAGDPCTSVQWDITRYPTSDLEIIEGDYPCTVAVLEFGISLEISLYVTVPGGQSQESTTMSVDSIDFSYSYDSGLSTHNLVGSVTIIDSTSSLVEGATVEIDWGFPGGSTFTLQATTDASGIATFTQNDVATGTHTITVTNVSISGLTYNSGSNVETTDNYLIEATVQLMHVEAISWSESGSHPNIAVTATITIYDDGNNPVAGATVTVEWTDTNGQTSQVSGTTAADGTISFQLTGLNKNKTVSIAVTNVTLTGWVYDSASNVITSDSYNT